MHTFPFGFPIVPLALADIESIWDAEELRIAVALAILNRSMFLSFSLFMSCSPFLHQSVHYFHCLMRLPPLLLLLLLLPVLSRSPAGAMCLDLDDGFVCMRTPAPRIQEQHHFRLLFTCTM